MMPETVETLSRARAILEHGWCQGNFAVDAHGRRKIPTSNDAVAHCLSGALIAGGDQHNKAWNAVRRVIGALPIEWNDAPGRTKAEVLAAIDRAIAAEGG